MKLLGSLFVAPDDALNVQEGGLGPALTIGDLSIHFRSEGKLLELLDHINAYVALAKPVCNHEFQGDWTLMGALICIWCSEKRGASNADVVG